MLSITCIEAGAIEQTQKKYQIRDLAFLDLARNSHFLSQLERDVVLELNKVRTNPAQYAELELEPLLKYYEGVYFRYPGRITIQTKEGAQALKECIKSLRRQSVVGLLQPSEGLSAAARDHANEQSKTGKVGHIGKRRSSPSERMNRHGMWDGRSAEIIDYGNNEAKWIVISLLIDDGVMDRGHRKIIFMPGLTKVGVACASHPVYQYMCVVDFAERYTEK